MLKGFNASFCWWRKYFLTSEPQKTRMESSIVGIFGAAVTWLQSNGLRVLGLILGLLEQLPGHVEDRLAFFSTVTGHETLLGDHTLETPLDASGVAANTVNSIGMGNQRHEFLCLLAETALKAGVEIHWEHNVVDIQQRSDSVQVTFENVTHGSLFGKEQASFTGLTQIGHDRITRPEAETKETWRAVDDTMLAKDPVSEWGFGAGELVKTAEKMVKFGLYDRPELATWYKNRVVLLGDAAHPTSPHLGQGCCPQNQHGTNRRADGHTSLFTFYFWCSQL
ncbi:hypothetical protein BT96DRAFT_981592, partial [Gymnopus androsaceus JB14]